MKINRTVSILILNNEEPLFVIRYIWWRILWRFFWPFSFFYLFFFWFFWGVPKSVAAGNPILFQFVRIMLLIAFVGCSFCIYTMLNAKEIYLYNDRIIQRFRWRREKVLFLEKTKYSTLSNWFLKILSLYDEDHPFFAPSYAVYIDGSLIAPRDLAMFMRILSRISRRYIEDLENQFFPTQLIK